MILHWALRARDRNAAKSSKEHTVLFHFSPHFLVNFVPRDKDILFLGRMSRKQLGWASCQHQSSARNRKHHFPETHNFHTKRHNGKVMKNEAPLLKNYLFSLPRTVLSLQQGRQQKRCHSLSSSFQRKEKVGKRKCGLYSKSENNNSQ